MSCRTMVSSPHVEHHRDGPSSISSLLNRTKTCDSQQVPKEVRLSSTQTPPRQKNDQLTVVASNCDSTLVSPVSPYQHLPTPKSPAVPLSQHSHSDDNKYILKSNPSLSSPPARTTVVVHHYEMIPRSTEDTTSGIYASFSLKDTSSSARLHNHSNNKVPATSTLRPFACTECDQTFSRAHNLKSHFATHSTDRPFKCDSCSAKFRRLHDLKRHQKLHTGERPYTCSTCQRGFSRLDALNRHQRTEGGSACHYRRRNTTPIIKVEETMMSIAKPAPTPKTPPPTTRERPIIPHLDLQHLNSSDRITLPSPKAHLQRTIHATPSPLSSPPHSFPEEQYYHRFPYPLSESPKNFASLQAAYAQLYDQYHSIQEGIHSRTLANEDEVKLLRQSLYDLQVENRVLRSLVVERHPTNDDAMNENRI
ncbi:hypothetical protein BX666DRAFT_1913897 [Dichotomocladium elegans]|nr:hypothetical protein BX666DRAFT_1913897 [Dichotomocladium elegans]